MDLAILYYIIDLFLVCSTCFRIILLFLLGVFSLFTFIVFSRRLCSLLPYFPLFFSFFFKCIYV